jgi:hypothetical protein
VERQFKKRRNKIQKGCSNKIWKELKKNGERKKGMKRRKKI